METNEIGIAIIAVTLIILFLIAGITISVLVSHRQRLNLSLAYEEELRNVQNEIAGQVLTDVARELHDDIGQSLTYLYMQMENRVLDNPALAEPVTQFQETLGDVTERLRGLSHSLNSDHILKQGLVKCISLETQRLKRLSRPAFSFHLERETVPLDKNQQLICFRIFQEMIQNILRHARAANVSVKVSCFPVFSLEVTDDGIGFDSTESRKKDGTGLQNMRHRAKVAGLHFEVTSEKNKGCTYKIYQK